MNKINIPDKDVSFFINRILSPVIRRPWWQDIEGEDRQGKSGRFLSEEFASELFNELNYETKTDNNKLHFFSDKKNCAIDGKFNDLGVELKCKDLSSKSLIDGAIHRGLLWVYGNPQNFTKQAKSLSIYLIKKGSKPINKELASLYFPVLKEIGKHGVYILFITQQGELWGNFDDANFNNFPAWLTSNFHISEMPPVNQYCFGHISNNVENLSERFLYGNSNKYIFRELISNVSAKVATMDWWNHMQMLEIGLLLRAKGYGAVIIGHNHSIEKQRIPAGHGIEKRVKSKMCNNHGILLDWKCTL